MFYIIEWNVQAEIDLGNHLVQPSHLIDEETEVRGCVKGQVADSQIYRLGWNPVSVTASPTHGPSDLTSSYLILKDWEHWTR